LIYKPQATQAPANHLSPYWGFFYDLLLCILKASANDDLVPNAFKVANPITLRWRDCAALLALHFDP
jgi:hypothetical protein